MDDSDRLTVRARTILFLQAETVMLELLIATNARLAEHPEHRSSAQRRILRAEDMLAETRESLEAMGATGEAQ